MNAPPPLNGGPDPNLTPSSPLSRNETGDGSGGSRGVFGGALAARGVLAVFLFGFAMVGAAEAPQVEAGTAMRIELEAQPLARSLRELAEAFGLKIVFFSDFTDGLQAPPLTGVFSPLEAFDALLAGTALEQVQVGPESVVIRPRAVSEADERSDAVKTARKSKPQIGQLGVAALGALLAGAGQTQDAAVPGEVGIVIEEIVVTALKRETNLQETPVAATVLDGDYLSDWGLRDIEEVGNRVAGLSFGAQSRATSVLSLRGAPSAGGAGLDSAVVLFIDEVYYGDPSYPVLDLLDLERLEVLRGPQGTLFGRNVVGGALSFVTQTPDENPRTAIEATYGSWDQIVLKGMASGPLADSTYGQLAFKYEESDGWAENLLTGNKLAGLDLVSVRGKLRHQPSDRLEIQLSADYFTDQSGGSPFFVLKGSTAPALQPGTLVGSKDKTQLSFDGGTDRKGGGVNLRATYDGEWLGGSTLTSITAWHSSDSLSIGPDQLPGSNAAVGNNHTSIRVENDTFSQELRLDGELDALTWVGGLYYLKTDATDTTRFGVRADPMSLIAFANTDPLNFFGIPTPPGTLFSPTNPLGFDSSNQTSIETESFAVFGHLTYAVSDWSNLTGGLRWTSDSKGGYISTAGDVGPANPFVVEIFKVDVDDSWDAVSGRVTLDASFDDLGAFDNLYAYASYARGFKSGGFTAASNSATSADPYDPEYADSYEVGIKTRFWQSRAQLNLIYFHTNYSDLQVDFIGVTESGIPQTYTSNAGKASVDGVETEFTALLSENLTLTASHSWIDGQYDKFDLGFGGDFSGNRIQQTPRNSMNFDLTYRVPLGSGQLSLNGNYSYRSEQTFGQNEAAETEVFGLTDYANVNATIAYAINGWRFSVWGKNLSDEQAVNTALIGAVEPFVRNPFLDPMNFSFTTGSLAPPRSYGVTVAKSWE